MRTFESDDLSHRVENGGVSIDTMCLDVGWVLRESKAHEEGDDSTIFLSRPIH